MRWNFHWGTSTWVPLTVLVATIGLFILVGLDKLDPMVLVTWLGGLLIPNPLERGPRE